MTDDESNIRGRLLDGALNFVRSVAGLPGVRRVSLIGSITTEKPDPKDVDLVVVVEDDADLTELARCARRLQGQLQGLNRGADVFLADPQGRYLGRTCPWKDCRPFVRMSCDALHCGRRHYLHDDLAAIRLSDGVIASAPAQLWPKVERRGPLPADVEQMLRQLE